MNSGDAPSDRATPSVGVVIPAWNRLQDTLECLASLRGSTHSNMCVVVVDNGSTSEFGTVIAEQFPEVRLVRSDTNLGFAGGVNLGIRAVEEQDPQFVLLLNNDTIVAPDAVGNLVEAALEYGQFQIFSPLITYAQPRDIVWFAGGSFNRTRTLVQHDYFQHSVAEVPAHVYPVAWVNGCALFAARDVLNQVGAFESKYFALWEEVDWCARATRFGFACAVQPKARIAHKVSATFGSQQSCRYVYLWHRNRLLFIRRHVGGGQAVVSTAGQFVLATQRAIEALRRQDGAAWPGIVALLQANIDAVLGRSGMPRLWCRDAR